MVINYDFMVQSMVDLIKELFIVKILLIAMDWNF